MVRAVEPVTSPVWVAFTAELSTLNTPCTFMSKFDPTLITPRSFVVAMGNPAFTLAEFTLNTPCAFMSKFDPTLITPRSFVVAMGNPAFTLVEFTLNTPCAFISKFAPTFIAPRSFVVAIGKELEGIFTALDLKPPEIACSRVIFRVDFGSPEFSSRAHTKKLPGLISVLEAIARSLIFIFDIIILYTYN
jgi:hypothetical protein